MADEGIRTDTVSCVEFAHFNDGPDAPLHCDVTWGCCGAAPSPGPQLALVIPPPSGPSPSLPSPPSTTATYYAGHPQRRQSHQARHVHLRLGVNVYSPGRSFISILQSVELMSKMKIHYTHSFAPKSLICCELLAFFEYYS